MKHIPSLLICFLLISVSFILEGHSSISGGDSYRIFLNDKLVLEQFEFQPRQKNMLSLPALGESDKLTIYYSHCGKVGSRRVIFVKDGHGASLKEWKFADGGQSGMQLMVKDIVQAIHKSGFATLYYGSRELANAKQLATLRVDGGITAKP